MNAKAYIPFAGAWSRILCLLVVVLLPGRLTAQLDRGEITGTVEDPSGAVVRNAKIVLTNDATNVNNHDQVHADRHVCF